MTARVVTRQFVVLITASFAVFTSFGVYLLALPLYVRDGLGASDAAVGIAFGVGSVGAVLAGPPAGRIADRAGRLSVLLAGALIMVAGYALLALAPPLEVVVLVRLVAGVGEAAFVVAAFTMVADAAPPERRGEAISLFTVGSYAGLALGPLLANVLLDDDRFGLVFLVAAALAALAALLVVPLAETRPASEEAAPRGFLPPRSALMPGLACCSPCSDSEASTPSPPCTPGRSASSDRGSSSRSSGPRSSPCASSADGCPTGSGRAGQRRSPACSSRSDS